MSLSELQSEQPGDYTALINRFAQASPQDRAKLERDLLDAGPAALQQLADTVVKDARRRRRIRRWTIGSILTLIGVLLAFVVITGNSDIISAFSNTWWMFGGGGAVAASQLQKKSASLLASLEDHRAVGALTELLDSPDQAVRSDAISGLTRLLPRLSASDTAMVPSGARSRLNGYLAAKHVGRHHKFAVAILTAWIQVGDEDAIPAVKNLAETPGDWEPFKAVQALAVDCLSVLQRRAEEHRLAATLLRAASSPAPEVLLRPAEGGSEANEESLLRPVNIPT